MLELYNEECIEGSRKFIKNESIDLIICDPPFGIEETKFEGLYKRESGLVVDGYKEAPEDYQEFSDAWIREATRILKPDGTFYLISGWSNLNCVLNSVVKNGLIQLNHLIWKYNFGVSATKKFVSSHYHILRVAKTEKVKFNTYCRYGNNEKDENEKSLLYADLEDVFTINKEYHQGKEKNQNKLPDELIKKLIMYSSNEEDLVCDFFMGNFTTAYCSIGLNRNVIGFEINKNAYDLHIENIKKLPFGFMMKEIKKPEVEIPKNKGKKITQEELNEVLKAHKENMKKKMTKKQSIEVLQKKFQRGKFSIINMLSK